MARLTAHTLGRAMVKGGEDGDLAVVEGDGCRGIDAPHPVGTIGGDGSAMSLVGDGHALALGRQQLGLPHQAQHPGFRAADPATRRRAHTFR